MRYGALGLPVAATQIADFGGRRVFTKDNRLLRIPQEDFCQVLSVPPSQKYQSDGCPTIVDICKQLQGNDQPQIDRRIFFKAQVVFWLLAAIDGHAKNFSIPLSSKGRFKLAPLHDITSARPALENGQIRHNKAKLPMSVGKSRHYVVDRISPRNFEQTADECGLTAGTAREVFCRARRSG